MFALFYVVLAPFVGAFADALPKGKVMFISNAIKVVGCLMMLFGSHPLMAYAVVGLGAAAYSPAKYGILTELLPASQLVKANGWIEGLTIASIILGVLLGGQLVGQHLSVLLLSIDIPLIDTGVDTPAESAIAALILVYMVAAWFNTRIPHTGVEMRPLRTDPSRNVLANTLALLPDFWACNNRLWRDKLGRSRCPPPPCSGARAATSSSSCWPGPLWRWATTPRRPRPSRGWWPLARPWARWWHPCACGSMPPPRSSRWALPWGCCSSSWCSSTTSGWRFRF